MRHSTSRSACEGCIQVFSSQEVFNKSVTAQPLVTRKQRKERCGCHRISDVNATTRASVLRCAKPKSRSAICDLAPKAHRHRHSLPSMSECSHQRMAIEPLTLAVRPSVNSVSFLHDGIAMRLRNYMYIIDQAQLDLPWWRLTYTGIKPQW